MAKSKSAAKKAKKPATSVANKTASRKLAPSQYKSFRLSKRIKHPRPKPLNAFKIFRSSNNLLLKNWKLFGSIMLIYLVLNIVLVKGLSSGTNIPELKQTFQALFTGAQAQLVTGVALFGLLLGSAGSTTSEVAGAYQSILLLIISLVLIWALRQVTAREKINVRDAFYKGMYPFIPFLLVLIVIGLQLLPLGISSFLYNIVFTNGLAVTAPEKILWAVLLLLLATLSLYMVSSSIFALYIVTLPDMKPLQALRSARELVRYRRWMIMRKVLFLPFVLLVLAAIITIPVLLFLTPVAQWLFFALTIVALAVAHSYMYSLYRELL